MMNVRRQILLWLLGLSDLTLLSLSLYVAIFERNALTSWTVVAQKTIHVHTVFALIILLLVWRIVFSMMGLYHSRRLSRRLLEIADLAKISVTATVLLGVICALFAVNIVTIVVLLRFWLLSTFCLTSSHLILRQCLRIARRNGRNLHHLIIVGTNARAVRFATDVVSRPELGYRLIGFVDDQWIGPIPEKEIAATIVCSMSEFRSYMRNEIIDEVVIALPVKSFYDQQLEMLQICGEHGVIARVLSDLFHGSIAETHVEGGKALPVVSFYSSPRDFMQLSAKRTVDILISSLLLLALSPLMIIVWLLVRLDSEGPAIFAQDRIGLNKRPFKMYKFRSMVANAEKLQPALESKNEAQGPVFKIKDDPRITKLGRILRKTSIDELPQLFNVLKGDMSLVGPRPLPTRDYSGFNEDWQRRRFSVRPGITCLWQVSGRSSISFDQWMHLDIEYIDRWSLWLDVKILARTIPTVVKGSGAV